MTLPVFAGFWVTLAGMNHDLSLHQRRRAPTSEELKGIPWLAQLQPAARTRAVASLLVGDALPDTKAAVKAVAEATVLA